MGRGEMQDASTHGAHDPDTDRDQRLPEPGHLRARERGAVDTELQVLEEDIRGRGERDAELIGAEAGATGAPEGQGVMQFLQAIFGIPARAVHVRVNPLRRLAQIRDDKSRIVARLTTRVPDDFGFDDRAARMRPRLRLVRKRSTNPVLRWT